MIESLNTPTSGLTNHKKLKLEWSKLKCRWFLEAIASLGVTLSLTDSLTNSQTHSQKYKFSPYQSKIYPTFTFSYHDIAGQLDLDGQLDIDDQLDLDGQVDQGSYLSCPQHTIPNDSFLNTCRMGFVSGGVLSGRRALWGAKVLF